MKLIKGNTGIWEIVIGLEVHAQVRSKSKLFSSESTEYGKEPNHNVSLFDAAMPGMLPVLNQYCVEQAIRSGLAIGAEIQLVSIFDRKNYFYPDLPSGYQISQFTDPIVIGGTVDIEDEEAVHKTIRVHHIHLEQDAGKSMHEKSAQYSYIDLNRAGIALMEVVSEPDMRSAVEAANYVKKIKSILQYAGTCDGNMEKGELRCDANISVRRQGESKLGTRCEIKNLNSVRNIMAAINYEAYRQVELLENDQKVEQQTRLFNPDTGETATLRSKEDANDYRYFPDPDLLPLKIEQSLVDELQSTLPELPDKKFDRYVNEWKIPKDVAGVLISERTATNFFEDVVVKSNQEPVFIANWVTVELFGRLNKAGITIDKCPISIENMINLFDLISDGTISRKIAKEVFSDMFDTGKDAVAIVKEKGLTQITDENDIRDIVVKIITNNKNEVELYKAGKEKLFGFFIGQIMKESDGKANPAAVNKILREELAK